MGNETSNSQDNENCNSNRNPNHKHEDDLTISDIFEKLQGPEREMIKTITISLYEMIIENFHSLVHLFYYLGSPEVEEANVSDITELRLESEFVIWLGTIQSKILNLKK